MIAVKHVKSVLLLFLVAILPSCYSTVQSTEVNGQRIATREGGELLTTAEVESVFGRRWQLIDCYLDRDNSIEPPDRCLLYLTAEVDSRTGIQARAFSGRSRSAIETDVRNTFTDSATGQARIIEGIGDTAYYGKSIHRHSEGSTIRHKLWVVEGNWRELLIIEMYMPGDSAETTDDATTLERLKALAAIALERF